MKKLFSLTLTVILCVLAATLIGCAGGGSSSIESVKIIGKPEQTVIYNDNFNSFRLSAEIKGEGEQAVEWKSSDTSVLVVDSYGVVIVVGEGSAQIIATAKNGDASDSVNVSTKYLGIKINGAPQGGLADLESAPLNLTAEILSSDTLSFDVVWSSSVAKVATVDETGKLELLSTGATLIKAQKADDEKIFGSFVLFVAEKTAGNPLWEEFNSASVSGGEINGKLEYAANSLTCSIGKTESGNRYLSLDGTTDGYITFKTDNLKPGGRYKLTVVYDADENAATSFEKYGDNAYSAIENQGVEDGRFEYTFDAKKSQMQIKLKVSGTEAFNVKLDSIKFELIPQGDYKDDIL